MTLQSDDRTGCKDAADRIRRVLEAADPEAGWAVGGPDGILARSDGPGTGPGAGPGHDGNGYEAPCHDAGALTGVLALWPVIGSLVAEGALHLHTPLTAYGAGAAARTPAGTTTHHLLTHGGGRSAHTAAAALTRLAEHLGGSPLPELAAVRIWQPLGMAGTRCADGTLYASLPDLARFLGHLLSPADHPVPRAWTAESLRIRTGELTPPRGLLWRPAAHGTWTHGDTAAVWVHPRRRRWAVLFPADPHGPLRRPFRDAVFASPPGP
ncbi:hypothetical protein HYE82_00680 [Streptomyces sp. BR123]|uniref:hypothetical protein n=1 Tax=Streptomyces sp. BR123 TaxID=2749828 RepID=UPI0015C45EBB|nr:hypothetical protein [Streptomyces sp. BR123]NXY92959.1 hypothetical protein [Streptomyces sp. BR123]